MNPRDLEPLDADLDALFEAERHRPPAADHVRDRVLSRVEATLGLGPGGGAPPSPPAPPSPSGAVASTASAHGAKSINVWAKVFGVGLAVVLLGGAIGWLVKGRAAPRGDVATPIVAAPKAEDPRAPLADEGVATAEPRHETSPEPRAPSTARLAKARASADEKPASRDGGLAAERKLIDAALGAVARGRNAEALELLERHAREFPRGQLTQERETLWIKALIGAGRRDEACRRASRFRKSYPRSIMIPTIDAACGENL